jgi:hypothetical protein
MRARTAFHVPFHLPEANGFHDFLPPFLCPCTYLILEGDSRTIIVSEIFPEWVRLFNDANFVVPFHLSIVTDVTDATLSPFTPVLQHKQFDGTLGSTLAMLM